MSSYASSTNRVIVGLVIIVTRYVANTYAYMKNF